MHFDATSREPSPQRELSHVDAIVNGRQVSVLDFLTALLHGRYSSDTITAEHGRRFVMGGIAALERAESVDAWAQWGIVPARHAWPEVYGRLADLAEELLADAVIDNFFFTHKPPALRVCCQTDPARRADLARLLRARVTSWQRDGVVSHLTPGVYEPEQHLFGGAASMAHVHRLFTVDTLAWLAFLRTPAPGPSWAYSLVLLRSLMTGVGIVDREDLDVWARIQRQTGRLRPGMDADKVDAVTAAVRTAWTDPHRADTRLSPAIAELADSYGARLGELAGRWREDYFQGGGATIGPREAVAFYTICHWNRGHLTMAVQSLVTAALADRMVRS